jgi:hypothetical protein
VLLVAATLLGLLAINAVWLNRQVLNEDNWTEASSELLDSEAVREQTANFLVDEAYAGIDVPAEVAAGLPPRAAPLAGPIAGALRTGADRAVNRLLERPRVQKLWEESNRRAHKRMLAVLEGGTENVSTSGGDITLELRDVLLNITDQTGFGAKAVDKLPPDAAEVTVVHSDELELAQDGLDAFRGLTIFLLIGSFGLFAIAVFVAGRRRETLRAVGFLFILIGLLALVERKVAGNALVNALADTDSTREAVEDVWTIYTSLLVQAAVSLIAYGVLFVFAAWLSGRTRPATVARRNLAPYLHSPGWAYGTTALIVLLIAAWAPTPANRNPVSMLLLAALLAFGVEMLRRQVAREHPGVTLESTAEARQERRERRREAIAGGGRRIRERFGGSEATTTSNATQGDTRLAQLERLGHLHETGVLDDEEFKREKSLVLAHDGPGA